MGRGKGVKCGKRGRIIPANIYQFKTVSKIATYSLLAVSVTKGHLGLIYAQTRYRRAYSAPDLTSWSFVVKAWREGKGVIERVNMC